MYGGAHRSVDMASSFRPDVILGFAIFRFAFCSGIPEVCTFNPLILEGTCSARYTDPAALLIENVFLSLAEADCELANPCNYPPHYSPRVWEEFDFIVVGAGSAGSVVANRLTEIAEWTVLLLEAGGDPPKTSEVPSFSSLLWKTNVDWQYYTDPEEPTCLGLEGNQCFWPRGKMLGGSSSNNLLLYVRGNARDYDIWESEGNIGWSYQDVLPYFKKSEDVRSLEVRSTPDFLKYHGIGGPLKVDDPNIQFLEPLTVLLAEGFSELGYLFNPDTNGKYQSGVCRQRATIEDGRRCSTAKAFLTPITSRTNIKVSKYSLVTKVLIDGLNKVAYGVEFIDSSGKTVRVLARKEVILSAGSINTPQLLMLSGIGPHNHLREFGITVTADLPVGKNLQDHPVGFGLMIALDYFIPETNEVEDMFNFLFDYNSMYSSLGLGTFNALIDTEESGIDYPNMQLYFTPFSRNSSGLSNILDIYGYRAEIKKQFLDINSHSFILVINPALLNPSSRGNIRLQSKNPMQHPKITTGYFSDPRDVDILTKAFNFLRNFAQTQPMRAAGAKLYEIKIESCTRYPFNSKHYMECFLRHMVRTTYHPVGSCHMGPLGHPEAVVDPQLRVQGVDRLRVVDASVMPRVTRGNTNAPTIMIAEKGSDLIKRTWLSTPYSGAKGFRRALPQYLDSWGYKVY